MLFTGKGDKGTTKFFDTKSGEREVCEDARAYLNRLSSLLFALARFVNFKRGIKEKNPHYR